MKVAAPVILSLAFHGLLAWAAMSLELPEADTSKLEPIQTLDFVNKPEPKPTPVAKQKKIARKKVQLPKSKRAYVKKAPVVTQKKSPVKTQLGKLDPQLGQKKSRPKDARRMRQLSGNLPPTYPMLDRIQRKSGQVTVLGYVNKSGRVSQVEVLRSTGTSQMNENAIKAFKKYRFQKGQQGWVEMPFAYRLSLNSKIISVRDREALKLIK